MHMDFGVAGSFTYLKAQLPACSQSSIECTLHCACGMTDSCVHVWDHVIPCRPFKRPKPDTKYRMEKTTVASKGWNRGTAGR